MQANVGARNESSVRLDQPERQRGGGVARFITFVFTPSGHRDGSLAIAASRAGGIGVLDAELEPRLDAVIEELERIAEHARGTFGLRLGSIEDATADALRPLAARGLAWLIVDLEAVDG